MCTCIMTKMLICLFNQDICHDFKLPKKKPNDLLILLEEKTTSSYKYNESFIFLRNFFITS